MSMGESEGGHFSAKALIIYTCPVDTEIILEKLGILHTGYMLVSNWARPEHVAFLIFSLRCNCDLNLPVTVQTSQENEPLLSR